jgi:hypothetical protein
MSTILTTLLLALAAGSAQADTFGLHVYTKHAAPGAEPADSAWHGQSKLWNDNTVGAYWRDDSGLTLGAYCNSYSRTERNLAPNGGRASIQQSSCNVTKYIGWTWETNLVGDLRVAASAVVMHGYGRNLHNITTGGANFYAVAVPSIALGPVRVTLVGQREYHLSLEHTWN